MWKSIFNFVLKNTIRSLAKEVVKAEKKEKAAKKAEEAAKARQKAEVKRKAAAESQAEKLKALQ